ncbi:MAG: hypothetical protein AABZ53_05165 [Planctomycetota bacterium]
MKLGTRLARVLPVLLAGQALGQCDIYWPGIPDFDQRRGSGFSSTALPGNGAMFCVPTASMNCLAVIDSAGYNLIPGANAQNWYQQNPLYNSVTTNLDELGSDYMGTGADSGSSFSAGVDGLQDWIDDRNQGDRFNVCGFEHDGDAFPKVAWIYNHIKASHLTMFSFGRWYRDGDQLERSGGHALTAVGVFDACDPDEPQLHYRDPNSSDHLWQQSHFTLVTRTLYHRWFNMDGDLCQVYTFNETETGTEETPVKVIDSFRWIVPSVAIGSSPINPSAIRRTKIAALPTEPPGVIDINTPSAAIMIDSAYSFVDHTYLLGLASTPSQAAGIFRYDPVDNSFTRISTLNRNPDRVLVDRFGHLYVQLGSEVKKYKLVDDTPLLLASYLLPSSPGAWAYDDKTDTLVMLTSGLTRVSRLSRSLTFVGDTPLPAGMTMSGEGAAALHPITGRLWVTSSGSPAAYEIGFDAAGRTNIVSLATHAQFHAPRGLQFNGLGHMFAACDGSVRSFAIDANGRWAPVVGGAWNELPDRSMGRLMDMSRSRHNAQAIHSGPAWLDIDPIDEPIPDGIIDCTGDFNLDGAVDFFDYDDYVRCFEGRTCPRGRDADIDRDGSVDFFDYDTFVLGFEQGC